MIRESLNPKVIIYARVSTEEQAEKGYSIESQIDKCFAKAISLKFEEDRIAILTDHCTGANLDRPGMARLREFVKNTAQKPEIIIIYEPDRLARNLTHQLIITDEIINNGIRLEFVAFEWRNTPEGKMFYQLRGIFAEYEREKIRERTIRGRMTKVQNHHKLSVNPRVFGYQFNQEDDTLILHPEESKVVKLIFHLASLGKSGEEIAKNLAESGTPAPRGSKWYGSTVTRILHNKTYLGVFMAYKTDYHQGFKRNRPIEEQFPILVDAIIDENIFKKAQETLERNRTKIGRPPIREYLLSGLGKCYCGRSMVASVKSGNRNYSYYTCTGKHKRIFDSETKRELKRCNSSYWNSSIVDDAVWSKIKHILFTQEKLVWKAQKQLNTQQLNQHDHMMEYHLLLDKATIIKRKKDKLVELFLTNNLDQEQYEQRRKLMNLEESKLQNRMVTLKTEIESFQSQFTMQDSDESMIDDYRDALVSLPFLQKKEVVELLVANVIFHQNQKLEIVLNIQEELV